VSADSSPATSTPPHRTAIEQLHELHVRAYSALHDEQERSKQPLCPKAITTLEDNQCVVQEFSVTELNYQGEIVALSGLVVGQRDHDGGTVSATPFDEAEVTWHTYREQACNAFAGPLESAGTIRPYMYETCLITLTRSHMNALGDLYAEVGMR